MRCHAATGPGRTQLFAQLLELLVVKVKARHHRTDDFKRQQLHLRCREAMPTTVLL